MSVVIPVYNAAATIGQLCRGLIGELGGHYLLDLVLVNDNSRDASEAACLAVQAEHPDRITYLRLARNFGEHNAVMAGLHHARGEYVVTMDDDLQNPPGEVEALLAEIRKGFDIVYGRFSRRDGSLRAFLSRLHGVLVRRLLRLPGYVSVSSFRVVNRFLLEEVVKHDGPRPYLDAIILKLTANVGTADVSHAPRRAGRSNYDVGRLLALWGTAVVSSSLIPLRAIGALGLLLAAVGLFRGGWLLLDLFHPAREDPGDHDRLLALTLFLRGLQLSATSLLGEYIGRVFLYQNRDRQFVVRRLVPALPAAAPAPVAIGAGSRGAPSAPVTAGPRGTP